MGTGILVLHNEVYNSCMDKPSFTQLLKLKGLFVTNARLQVLHVLTKAGEPLTIENIAKRSKEDLPVSTLYRVIADLLDVNLVNTFSSPDQKLMVELSEDMNEHHHHHLYCESCGKVLDIDLDLEMEKMIDNLIIKIEKTQGIEIKKHSFEMYGRCNEPGKHVN